VDSSESDGKLATGNAVKEQANTPKVVNSLWLVKLLLLLNVTRASSNCFLLPHHQKNDGGGDHPGQSDQFFVGAGSGGSIRILRFLCRQHIRVP
jgi:hypothetical protein